MASFTASDEEDGTPSVDFTPGTNTNNYYVINGTTVELTAAGATFVQGGGTLPAVDLTATDSSGLTATDSETPSVTAQNDGPVIDVVLAAALMKTQPQPVIPWPASLRAMKKTARRAWTSHRY